MNPLSDSVPALDAPVVEAASSGITWSGGWSPPLLLNGSALTIARQFDDSATSFEVAESLLRHLPDGATSIEELTGFTNRIADTLDHYGLLTGSVGYGLDAAAQMLPSDPNH